MRLQLIVVDRQEADMIPYGHERIAGWLCALALVVTATLGLCCPAAAQGLFDQPKYAAVVVDASTGEVLYTRRPNAERFPASLTKLMTLYLTFEALSTGRLSASDSVTFSRWATLQAPSKLGVEEGRSLTVNQAVQAAAVKSANDVAVALAEKIGGSEARFAQLMTLRAQELGMTGTRYVNASGLPDARQVTTARDIAILSRALMRDYPQYYAYFGQRSFNWRGQSTLNHNHLLMKMPGVDGLKTGYTNAAGFNLAASAVRSGRRLIAVVLGGSSTAARDENVEDLLNAGFDVMGGRTRGEHLTLASVLHAPVDDAAGPVTRPLLEMGSADQPSLRVIARQPQPLRLADLETSLPRASASRVDAADCSALHGHRRRAACRRIGSRAAGGCASRHGLRNAACRASTPQVAAATCGRHGRRARACRTEARREALQVAATHIPHATCHHAGHRHVCTARLQTASIRGRTHAGRREIRLSALNGRHAERSSRHHHTHRWRTA